MATQSDEEKPPPCPECGSAREWSDYWTDAPVALCVPCEAKRSMTGRTGEHRPDGKCWTGDCSERHFGALAPLPEGYSVWWHGEHEHYFEESTSSEDRERAEAFLRGELPDWP